MIEDIDYMAQQAMKQGTMPSDFYRNSFSDFMAAQNAKSRKDRLQDPLAFAKEVGGLSHF